MISGMFLPCSMIWKGSTCCISNPRHCETLKTSTEPSHCLNITRFVFVSAPALLFLNCGLKMLSSSSFSSFVFFGVCSYCLDLCVKTIFSTISTNGFFSIFHSPIVISKSSDPSCAFSLSSPWSDGSMFWISSIYSLYGSAAYSRLCVRSVNLDVFTVSKGGGL